MGDGARYLPPREIPLPAELLPVLTLGHTRCAPTDVVFAGARVGEPISRRTVDRIVKQAARRADLVSCVTASTLRHSFAVQCLYDGWNIRRLQTVLGHRNILSTLMYQRCIPPRIVSPLASFKGQAMVPPAPAPRLPLPRLDPDQLKTILEPLCPVLGGFRKIMQFALRGNPFRSRAPSG